MPSIIVAAIGLTGVAASIATALIGFGISYALESLFAPDEPQAPADQGVQARIPTNPKNKLPVVYGEQRVGGQNIMADISSDNQTMAFIIALSEGPVEAINRVTWEDKVITFNETDLSGGLRTVTTTTTDEGETSSFLNGNFKCRVFPSGGPCPEMESFSSRWNTNKEFRLMPNTAYAYIELTYNREERVTGLPGRLFFNVKGRRVDRLQSDGTFDTSTTMSTNPVDNLLDFLTNEVYGCGISTDGLDLPSFYKHKVFCDRPIESTANNFCSFASNATTIANGRTSSTGTYGEEDFLPSQLADASEFNNQRDCEEATAFVGTTGVSATWQNASDGVLTIEKPRYTTNGVLNTNGELDRSISDLTIGNGGIFTYNLGKFGIVSEGTRDVAARDGVNVAFSEDNIIGKLDITGSGFDAVLNECTLKFTSIRQKYQQEQVRVAYDALLLPNSVQNPNEPRLEKTMQLPFTNNDVEARRIGRVLINDSRQALIVNFQANIDNTDLQAGDIIEIAHATPGWPTAVDITAGRAGKLFRIQQVDEKVIDQDNMSVGVSLIAREYASEVYTSETLLLQDPAPNTNFPNPLVVSTPVIAAGDASTILNGVPTSQIRVDWSGTANTTYNAFADVRYVVRTTGTPPVDDDSSWISLSTNSTDLTITDLLPDTRYHIQVRLHNTLGAQGPFVLFVDGSSDNFVETADLDSIALLEIQISSDNGGTIFRNNTGTKEMTATVFISSEARPDTTTSGVNGHETFSYQWSQDTQVICLAGNTNDVVGVATRTIQSLPRDPDSNDAADELACDSAGGTWVTDAGTGGNQVQCQDGSGNVFGTQSDSILGCTVAASNRADTDNTGSSLSSIRTITVEANDVQGSSGLTVSVSNIN